MSNFGQLPLKPEDFRKVWPSALAAVMEQVEDLMEQVEGAASRMEATVAGPHARYEASMASIADDVATQTRLFEERANAATRGLEATARAVLEDARRAAREPIDALTTASLRLEAASIDLQVQRAANERVIEKMEQCRLRLELYEEKVTQRLACAKAAAYKNLDLVSRFMAVFVRPSLPVVSPRPPAYGNDPRSATE